MEDEKFNAQKKANRNQDKKRASQPRLPSARITEEEFKLLEEVKELSGLGYKDMILNAVALLKDKINKKQ